MAFYSEIYERFRAKTPKFFKRVIWFATFIGSTGGGIMVAGDTVPQKIHDIGSYMVTVGIVGGAVAKLTKDDTKEVIVKEETPQA